MSARDKERWNEKHAQCQPSLTVKPDEWLVEALDLIEQADTPSQPPRTALDLACGQGHNAIWLARQGWQADGVDISREGLKRAQQCAKANEATVTWIEADLDDWTPPPNRYDLALVFRFLDRVSVPSVVQAAVRPGGWLVYETFSAAQCDRADSHISNPTFTLAPGELSELFPDFQALASREDVLPDRTVRRFLGRRKPNR